MHQKTKAIDKRQGAIKIYKEIDNTMKSYTSDCSKKILSILFVVSTMDTMYVSCAI